MKKQLAMKIAISIHPSDLKTLDKLAERAGTSRSGMITDMTRLMAAVPDSKEIGLLLADTVRRAIQAK